MGYPEPGYRKRPDTTDGFIRDVFPLASLDWDSKNTHRIRKLRAPAYSLNDAPAAFHRSLQKYSANPVESLASLGFRFEVSSRDPRLYYVFEEAGGAAGALATHTGGILGCGYRDILLKTRAFLEARSGSSKVQEKSPVHVGMELTRENNFSVTLTQGHFTKNRKRIPTSPELRAARQKLSPAEEIKIRQ